MPTSLAELRAPNAEAARAFYGEVLQCRFEERALDESRPRFACVRGDEDVALIVQAAQVVVSEGGSAAWGGAPARFDVEDLVPAVGRATALGARILAAADGEIRLLDPQGGAFTLLG